MWLKKISSFFCNLENRLLSVSKKSVNEERCCTTDTSTYPEHPLAVVEPTKVIEERLAEVAEKKVTAKEIKSKVKRTPVESKVVKQPSKPKLENKPKQVNRPKKTPPTKPKA